MYTSVAVPISKLDPFGSVSVVDVGVRFSMESLLYPSKVREGTMPLVTVPSLYSVKFTVVERYHANKRIELFVDDIVASL
jgi:hypothetical protein